jgi:HSP20 family protein
MVVNRSHRCYHQNVAFARWDPVRDLLAIQQRLDPFAPGPAGWAPAVDLQETAEDYVLTAELPGVAREDIDIQLREDRLTLSGVRRDRGVPCEQYHRLERGHGAFSRTFQLPVPVDADQVVADLRDGILTVTCPKARDGSTRRIDVL